jgi:hypothetical protein
MKTKHFIEELERMGLNVSIEDQSISIYLANWLLARVGLYTRFGVSTYLTLHIEPELFSLIYRYTTTPVYKRGDKKEEVEND